MPPSLWSFPQRRRRRRRRRATFCSTYDPPRHLLGSSELSRGKSIGKVFIGSRLGIPRRLSTSPARSANATTASHAAVSARMKSCESSNADAFAESLDLVPLSPLGLPRQPLRAISIAPDWGEIREHSRLSVGPFIRSIGYQFRCTSNIRGVISDRRVFSATIGFFVEVLVKSKDPILRTGAIRRMDAGTFRPGVICDEDPTGNI